MGQELSKFWNIQIEFLLQQLRSTSQGLTDEEASQRLKRFGSNLLKPKKKSNASGLFFNQFKSPIILILIFAAILSYFLHDQMDAGIILIIVCVSGLLGFWQEKGASDAILKLLSIVQIKALVLRDGVKKEIPVEEIVPGDVVMLGAGDVVPGDSMVLESKDLFVDEATLTGESYPAEKTAGTLPPETPLSQRANTLFMGTHVVSGNAKAMIVLTGKETEFGKVSQHLNLREPETEFERGVRNFGYLLLEITLMLIIVIFAVNVLLVRPILDSFLFSLALAIGLTPQLLPAIITINLAHGAKDMVRKKVIVKRLESIENFGSMNVFCSDKTGTLTEGTMELHSALDVDGQESEKVQFYSYLNAFYETGFANPIDETIRRYRKFDVSGYGKVDEVPYDFVRKRLSILVSKIDNHVMITKGALQNVLTVCSTAENSRGESMDIETVRDQIQKRFVQLSTQGFRVLGIAYQHWSPGLGITKESETDMTFLGFLVFFDPPKSGIAETIARLKNLGVSLKIITGDSRLVASHLCQQVGLSHPQIITGSELAHMREDVMWNRVNQMDVFAEVEPNQKERIILALKRAGNVVGYMGDGINDVSALHVADVSISVESAVDVAKEASDIVLLEKNLAVLIDGVLEGRRTFANTLKYVFMSVSANFGNMFSMAGASLFLPFLPLLPKQILLLNLMTDFPEMTIATDNVDNEMVERPRRWNIKFIRNFMITFGILSSVFDCATFFVLLVVLHATMDLFRTGWFIESVVSASLIVLVIRSRRLFFKSPPGKYLLVVTLLICALALVLPFTKIGEIFGFKPLALSFLPALGMIVGFYILTAELAKKLFYKKAHY